MSLTAEGTEPLAAIRQLDYIILLCDDPVKMRTFYQNVMGFPVYRDKWDGAWVELRVGSILLTLRPRGWLTLGGKHADGNKTAGSASIQLAFRVTRAEVDACHQRLVEQGVEILDPPTDQPWAHRTVFFRDPEGNLLEIYADL